MTRTPASKRRPSIQITMSRAARLYQLVRLLQEGPRSRDLILSRLAIGLRTFYRELELLNRCGVKVRLRDKAYALQSTLEAAEGRLPFPDPQLSFAEMAELAALPGEAARRLADLLGRVTDGTPPPKKSGGRASGAKSKKT